MSVKNSMRIILTECEQALGSIDATQIEQMIDEINCAQKVYFVGVGRVMLSLEAICKRLAHLGISAHCVGEITEPAITKNDLLIVASGSGESLVPKVIAQKAKSLGAQIAWIGSNHTSTIAQLADVHVRIPVPTKTVLSDELSSCQPMTSLFEQSLLLLGDALAMEIIHRRSINIHELWCYHANLE